MDPNNLLAEGLAFSEENRLHEATACFAQALRIDPTLARRLVRQRTCAG